MNDELNTSIARLEKFIATYPEGDPIDADMPLTVEDVRRVIEAAKVGGRMVSIPRLDLNNLPKL